MKTLNDILKNVQVEKISGSTDIPINNISLDSRTITPNSVFFAVKGHNIDGYKFIPNAIKAGATAIVASQEIPQELHQGKACCVMVQDMQETMGIMASNLYDNPTSKIKLIGVTGTNGKTTIATLLYKLFNNLGKKAGLISTIANYIAQEKIPTQNTTPDIITFNKLLDKMIAQGCEYCFAEVSSHAIDQRRIEQLSFKGVVFTNITHDHLDYHKTFKNYLYAKKRLFDNLPKDAFALVNLDDKNSKIMLQNCNARKYYYAIKQPATFQTKIIEKTFDGMKLQIENQEFWTLLTGNFNAQNITALFATAKILDIPSIEILKTISTLKPIDGRLDTINLAGRTAIVDYAHTPDALLNVLKTIGEIKNNTQKIITVVGAGGDRDKEKRPLLAKIAQQNSDLTILTSDNPRTENPENIINDMKAGISNENENKVISIINRKQAIEQAIKTSQKNDIILIAGKGHETYQETNGVKTHFDDKEIATQILNELN